jgi:hypothetical protein
MKKFSVLVTTTFDGYVDVEANTKEEAIEQVWQMIRLGEINTLDFEPYTDIPYADEVGHSDRDYKDGGFVNATEERKFNEDMEGK